MEKNWIILSFFKIRYFLILKFKIKINVSPRFILLECLKNVSHLRTTILQVLKGLFQTVNDAIKIFIKSCNRKLETYNYGHSQRWTFSKSNFRSCDSDDHIVVGMNGKYWHRTKFDNFSFLIWIKGAYLIIYKNTIELSFS